MTRAQRSASFAGPALGRGFGLALVALARALPAITGWEVHVRHFPPLHADWDPRLGPGTAPALLIGALAIGWSVPLAERWPWRRLLLSAYVGGVAWLFSLALLDGAGGVSQN